MTWWGLILQIMSFFHQKTVLDQREKKLFIKFILESYSSIEIEDYQVTIDLAVTEGNGDELVLFWDNGKIVTPDGKESNYSWVETFRFEGDKIAYMNQFSKPRN